MTRKRAAKVMDEAELHALMLRMTPAERGAVGADGFVVQPTTAIPHGHSWNAVQARYEKTTKSACG